MRQQKPKVFLVCTGVGHINRGYESFSVECFEQLKVSDKFELFFIKNIQSPPYYLIVWCITQLI